MYQVRAAVLWARHSYNRLGVTATLDANTPRQRTFRRSVNRKDSFSTATPLYHPLWWLFCAYVRRFG